MLILIEVGRRVRARHGSTTTDKLEFSAIEGGILGLFALLLAFTFSGAMSRWDAHRAFIAQEAMDIHKAYLQIDLLPPNARPPLRQLFRQYADIRVHRFDSGHGTPQSAALSSQSKRLQEAIWTQSLQAVAAPGANPDAAKLMLPAVNAMIDVTFERRNEFDMHPPAIVNILLLTLSCACALLAGYGMTGERRSLVLMFGFAFFVAFTIYATLEIEYPRLGIIHMTEHNQVLVNVRDSMH